jgi:hypothetical protein
MEDKTSVAGLDYLEAATKVNGGGFHEEKRVVDIDPHGDVGRRPGVSGMRGGRGHP